MWEKFISSHVSCKCCWLSIPRDLVSLTSDVENVNLCMTFHPYQRNPGHCLLVSIASKPPAKYRDANYNHHLTRSPALQSGSREDSARPWALRLLADLSRLPLLHDDVIWDDRDQLTIGQRVREARRSGHPAVLVFGRAAAAESGPGRPDQSPRAELVTAEGSQLLTEAELPERLTQLLTTG